MVQVACSIIVLGSSRAPIESSSTPSHPLHLCHDFLILLHQLLVSLCLLCQHTPLCEHLGWLLQEPGGGRERRWEER